MSGAISTDTINKSNNRHHNDHHAIRTAARGINLSPLAGRAPQWATCMSAILHLIWLHCARCSVKTDRSFQSGRITMRVHRACAVQCNVHCINAIRWQQWTPATVHTKDGRIRANISSMADYLAPVRTSTATKRREWHQRQIMMALVRCEDNRGINQCAARRATAHLATESKPSPQQSRPFRPAMTLA